MQELSEKCMIRRHSMEEIGGRTKENLLENVLQQEEK